MTKWKDNQTVELISQLAEAKEEIVRLTEERDAFCSLARRTEALLPPSEGGLHTNDDGSVSVNVLPVRVRTEIERLQTILIEIHSLAQQVLSFEENDYYAWPEIVRLCLAVETSRFSSKGTTLNKSNTPKESE